MCVLYMLIHKSKGDREADFVHKQIARNQWTKFFTYPYRVITSGKFESW